MCNEPEEAIDAIFVATGKARATEPWQDPAPPLVRKPPPPRLYPNSGRPDVNNNLVLWLCSIRHKPLRHNFSFTYLRTLSTSHPSRGRLRILTNKHEDARALSRH